MSNSTIITILNQIPALDHSNWFTWKSDMEMALSMDGSDAVVMQPDEKPTEAKERKAWEAKDKSSKTYIWLRLSPELRPLAAEHSSGSSLWSALKTKFETSTMARCIAAC